MAISFTKNPDTWTIEGDGLSGNATERPELGEVEVHVMFPDGRHMRYMAPNLAKAEKYADYLSEEQGVADVKFKARIDADKNK